MSQCAHLFIHSEINKIVEWQKKQCLYIKYIAIHQKKVLSWSKGEKVVRWTFPFNTRLATSSNTFYRILEHRRGRIKRDATIDSVFCTELHYLLFLESWYHTVRLVIDFLDGRTTLKRLINKTKTKLRLRNSNLD